jgi:hypothetical protein
MPITTACHGRYSEDIYNHLKRCKIIAGFDDVAGGDVILKRRKSVFGAAGIKEI